MDSGSKQISMERVEVLSRFHKHPLIPFSRFDFSKCKGCSSNHSTYIYGGYRCNEPGCDIVFHKECAEALPEINHSYHSGHSLKLINPSPEPCRCSFCEDEFKVGYCCSICDYKLDLKCAMRPSPFVLPKNSYRHEHPLQLSFHEKLWNVEDPTLVRFCKACNYRIFYSQRYYGCHQCDYTIHLQCANVGPEAYHTSHPQHPLKPLDGEVPDYADKNCLLCGAEFNHLLHHCDICNFSICRVCMGNPPPLVVESRTTHEHQLLLVLRRINFTCNACGTQGDQSPYFCLQCNFMIHRECVDLPRVININRHDHHISYTSRLGHGEWKCKVCRQDVNGFYGAYTCSKCSNYVVHSRCATRKDVWDMVELEGTPEEEEVAPFKVIDASTIRHFSHGHNLRINKDGLVVHENICCEACVLQISSECFYSCEQCQFILHEKCANLPLKKRHVCHNQPFTLHADARHKMSKCVLCHQQFTGFRYKSGRHFTLDVRCGSMTDSFKHESHAHLLYYSTHNRKCCSECEQGERQYFEGVFSCDECDFRLDYKCMLLPQKIMRYRYDDHPLFLSYGESNVDGEYWCEACEKKVNPEKWFYTCHVCGVVLHISCMVGDFSYVMTGSITRSDAQVVSNTSICRPLCLWCNSQCNLPSTLKVSKDGLDLYFCSSLCDMIYNF